VFLTGCGCGKRDEDSVVALRHIATQGRVLINHGHRLGVMKHVYVTHAFCRRISQRLFMQQPPLHDALSDLASHPPPPPLHPPATHTPQVPCVGCNRPRERVTGGFGCENQVGARFPLVSEFCGNDSPKASDGVAISPGTSDEPSGENTHQNHQQLVGMNAGSADMPPAPVLSVSLALLPHTMTPLVSSD